MIYRDFKALFYAGGHGPMFDLADNQDVAQLAAKVYENGGVIGAVCHGTVGKLVTTPLVVSSCSVKLIRFKLKSLLYGEHSLALCERVFNINHANEEAMYNDF